MVIYNFDHLPVSDRNGTYGGASGDKEGVLLNGEYWLIKYPKDARNLNDVGSLKFNLSPQSEYIGSHIYNVLGIPVHQTMLGIRDHHVVVACKDFCDNEHRLIEFRQLKNTHNQELNEQLSASLSSTHDAHYVDLQAVKIHLQYNPELKDIEGLADRFWDCVVVDGLISNSDRNNGNWGLLRSKTETLIAPVYDNGNSFSTNISESKVVRKLHNSQVLRDGALHNRTAYSLNGTTAALFADLLNANIPELNDAIKRLTPLITKRLDQITEIIREIPEFVNSRGETYQILSPARKQLYTQELAIRTNELILPAYHRILEQEQEHDKSARNHSSHDDDDLEL